jgi:transcription termination/antitermination protein NusA
MKITYTKELLEVMNIFSHMTHASLKDCFEYDELLYFIVLPGQVGKAVGKEGTNVKRLQQKLNRRIKIVEFSDSAIKFVKNLIYPLRVEISEDNGTVYIRSDDRQTKARIIGRDAKHLNMVSSVVKRYFSVDIKVE